MKRRKPRQLTKSDLERLRIGRHYWDADIASLHLGTSHRDVVLHYCAKIHTAHAQGKGLLFWGDNGRGKTYSSASILKHARSWGYSGLLLRATDLVPSIVEDWVFESGPLGTTNYERRMRSVDFLVIDDLGKETLGKGFFLSAMDRILRDRAQEARPVIITTNLPLKHESEDSFETRYGRSAFDLVHETMYPFQIKGRNRSERRL